MNTDPGGFDPWHLIHGAWAAMAVVGGWIWRQHLKQDDDRFAAIQEDLTRIGTRLETVSDRQSTNHSELMKLLLEQSQQSARDAADRLAYLKLTTRGNGSRRNQ